jgi:hypothetical protein
MHPDVSCSGIYRNKFMYWEGVIVKKALHSFNLDTYKFIKRRSLSLVIDPHRQITLWAISGRLLLPFLPFQCHGIERFVT